MDSAQAQQLTKEIRPAIDAILKAHGYECEIRDLKLTGLDMLSSRLVIKPIGTDLQLQAFLTYAHLYGCTASDYKREVRSGGLLFYIIGFSPKRPKYPVDAIRVSDGKTFYLTRDCLDQLKAAPAEAPKAKGKGKGKGAAGTGAASR